MNRRELLKWIAAAPALAVVPGVAKASELGRWPQEMLDRWNALVECGLRPKAVETILRSEYVTNEIWCESFDFGNRIAVAWRHGNERLSTWRYAPKVTSIKTTSDFPLRTAADDCVVKVWSRKIERDAMDRPLLKFYKL